MSGNFSIQHPVTNILTDGDAVGLNTTHLTSPFYGYVPTRSVCYIFTVMFGISMMIHTLQAIRFRAWWIFPTVVLATAGETLGWSGRLWSSYSPLNEKPYLMQTICTIISPTPLVGAIFISFGKISTQLGEQYSHLDAKLYSSIFLTSDVLALLVQTAGGIIIVSASNPPSFQLGTHIILSGIVFQLASLSIFCVLVADYLGRYSQDIPVKRLVTDDLSATTASVGSAEVRPMRLPVKLLVLAVCVETFFLFVRAVYRTVELADGFGGQIVLTETYFNVLDGTMVVLAIYGFCIFHPTWLVSMGKLRTSPVSSA